MDEKELLEALRKDILKACDSIAEEMKEIESKVIKEVVYEAYQPQTYRRREDDRGLSDTKNMHEEIMPTSDGVHIEVTNYTTGNENYYDAQGYTAGLIQDIIIEGEGYGYGLDSVIGPRDFITAAQEQIDNSDEVDDVLEKELRRLGW